MWCWTMGLELQHQHITEWKEGSGQDPGASLPTSPLYVTKAMKQQKERFQVHMRFQGKKKATEKNGEEV